MASSRVELDFTDEKTLSTDDEALLQAHNTGIASDADDERTPSEEEKALFEACDANDLPQLIHLLHNHSEPGAENSTCICHKLPLYGPIADFFDAAIGHKQSKLVAHLFTLYSDTTFCEHSSVVNMILDHADLETLKVVQAHYPDIVHFEYSCMDGILTRACSGGPRLAPIVLFLLDHGALTDFSFFRNTLHDAIFGKQPIEVMVKMIEKGTPVEYAVSSAIRERRADVLVLFFGSPWLKTSSKSRGEWMNEANKTGDEEVVRVVRRFNSRPKHVVQDVVGWVRHGVSVRNGDGKVEMESVTKAEQAEDDGLL